MVPQTVMTTKGLVPNSRCSKALISQCISTYSKVVAEVYKRKLRPNTLQQALDDDEWRYTELPSQLSPIKKDTCLTKDDVTRLVRWKMYVISKESHCVNLCGDREA